MIVEFWYVLAAPLVIGLAIYFINFWLAKRKDAVLSHNFWISLLIMVLATGGLLYFLQVRNNLNLNLKITQLEDKHQQDIQRMKDEYSKETLENYCCRFTVSSIVCWSTRCKCG